MGSVCVKEMYKEINKPSSSTVGNQKMIPKTGNFFKQQYSFLKVQVNIKGKCLEG